MAIYHLFYVCRLVCATLPSLQAPPEHKQADRWFLHHISWVWAIGQANQMGSCENILSPSPCVFQLPSFLCCVTSQMSHTETGYMIRERGREGTMAVFWYCWLLEITSCALEETSGWSRYSRNQNLLVH